MEKIIFTNSQGLSVEIGTDGPFILRKFEGAGAVTVNINAQKAPYQDGVTYIDNVLEPRSLFIELTVLAENSSEMAIRRRELTQAFNPKLGPGLLVYEFGGSSHRIEVITELAPVFPHAAPFEEVMQPGLISLYCPNPYWRDAEKRVDLPEGSLVAIENAGDMDIPPEFIIYGPAENPRVENLTTAKSIALTGSLNEGEQLNITTEQGQKGIIKISEEGRSNVFHWLNTEGSELFHLPPGTNIIRYTGGAIAELLYSSLFVGV